MRRRVWSAMAAGWLAAGAAVAISPDTLHLDRQIERDQAVAHHELARREREEEREREKRAVEQAMRMRWDDFRGSVRGGAPVPPPERPAREAAGESRHRGQPFWIPLAVVALFIAGVKLATSRMKPAAGSALDDLLADRPLNPALREEGE
jgi:hypothetical protein